VSFHYLIDGYNILYALPDMPAGTWGQKRGALVRKIAAEKPHGRNRITVVFDSREGSGDRSRLGSIEVAFTSGETADDWISHYVRHAANPRTLIVVSDDQGLRRMVRGTGAKWLETHEFWEKSKKRQGSTSEPEAQIDADSITDEFKKKWL
jgi:predicted RNA-binding protein with PIN domain